MESNPSEESKSKSGVLTISAIRASKLAKGWGPFRYKFYVVVTVDGCDVKTPKSSYTRNPRWDNLEAFLTFATSLPATPKFKIFRARLFRKDEYIEEFETTMDSIKDFHLHGSSTTTAAVLDIDVKYTEGFSNVLNDLPPLAPSATPPAMTVLNNVVALTGPVSSIAKGVMETSIAQEVMETSIFANLRKNFDQFMTIMDKVSAIHPYLQVAWTLLDSVYSAYKQEVEAVEKLRTLLDQLGSLYSFILVAMTKIESITGGSIDNSERVDILQKVVITTIQCFYFVRARVSRKMLVRMSKNLIHNVNDDIAEYQTALESLRKAFDDESKISTELIGYRVWKSVVELSKDQKLSELPYAPGAALSTTKICLEGTRKGPLKTIISWALDLEEKDEQILFLYGVAGEGKTTIANTIANRLKSLDRLGASFSFDRNESDRTVTKLFPTIARSLADLDPCFRRALYERVGSSTEIRNTTDLETQFDEFLVKPMEKCVFVGPILIIVDGLEDCDKPDELARVLTSGKYELPTSLRILITSRAEKQIIARFDISERKVLKLELGTVESPQAVEAEVSLYVKDRLSSCLSSSKVGDRDHLTIEECELLAQRCEGLYQWAHIACSYILQPPSSLEPPRSCYELVMEKKFLNDLYMVVLNDLFHDDQEQALLGLNRVLGLLLVANKPLNMNELQTLYERFGDGTRCVATFLRPLGSLLHGVVGKDEKDPVRILHSSFRDFLMSDGSGAFRIDVDHAHSDMVLCSLHIMKLELKLNIGGIKTSYIALDHVPACSSQAISTHLRYACFFWAYHLGHCISADYDILTLSGAVVDFLRCRFTYWLEVMSLCKETSRAIYCLGHARKSLDSWTPPKGQSFGRQTDSVLVMKKLLDDAFTFVSTYESVISESIPHMYLSAIPLTAERSEGTSLPSDGSLLATYRSRIRSHSFRIVHHEEVDSRHVTGSDLGIDTTAPGQDEASSQTPTNDLVVISPDSQYMATHGEMLYVADRSNGNHAILSLAVGRRPEPTVIDMAFYYRPETAIPHLLTLVEDLDRAGKQRVQVWVWAWQQGHRECVRELKDFDVQWNSPLLKLSLNGRYVLSIAADDPTALFVWPVYHDLDKDLDPQSAKQNTSQSYDGGKHKSFLPRQQRCSLDGANFASTRPTVLSSSRGLGHTCLVSCGFSAGRVIVWRLNALATESDSYMPTHLEMPSHEDSMQVDAISFSADENLVLVGYSRRNGGSPRVVLWDIRDRAAVRMIHTTNMLTTGSISQLVLISEPGTRHGFGRIIVALNGAIIAHSLDPDVCSSSIVAHHNPLRRKTPIKYMAADEDGRTVYIVDAGNKLSTYRTKGEDGLAETDWIMVADKLCGIPIGFASDLVRFAYVDDKPQIEVINAKGLSGTGRRWDDLPFLSTKRVSRQPILWAAFPDIFRSSWTAHVRSCSVLKNRRYAPRERGAPPPLDTQTPELSTSRSANGGGWSGHVKGTDRIKVAAVSSDGKWFSALVELTQSEAKQSESAKSLEDRIWPETYEIHVWDSKGKCLLLDGSPLANKYRKGAFNLVFSPRGDHLAASNHDRVLVWHLSPFWEEEHGVPQRYMILPPSKEPVVIHLFRPTEVLCLAISPKSTRIAIGSIDGLEIFDTRWTLRYGPVMRCEGNVAPNGICSVAYSADGDLLASLSADGVVRVWDVSKSSETTYVSPRPRILFSHDLSHAMPSTIKLFDEPNAAKAKAHAAITNSTRFDAEDPGNRDFGHIEDLLRRADGFMIAKIGGIDKLLCWVSPRHRIRHAREIWESTGSHTDFDLSKFKHGEGWDACYNCPEDVREDNWDQEEVETLLMFGEYSSTDSEDEEDRLDVESASDDGDPTQDEDEDEDVTLVSGNILDIGVKKDRPESWLRDSVSSFMGMVFGSSGPNTPPTASGSSTPITPSQDESKQA